MTSETRPRPAQRSADLEPGRQGEQEGFPQEGTSDLDLQNGQTSIVHRAGEAFRIEGRAL